MWDKIISKEDCEEIFAPFDRGDMIFPAIDPLLESLLCEVEQTDSRVIREFCVEKMGLHPINYFSSFQKETLCISMTANEILEHFIHNIRGCFINSWYVLNTKPNDDSSDDKDYRMVCIRALNNNKFFIYCYEYKSWSIVGGGWIENDAKFFVPFTTPVEVKDDDNIQA